MGRHSPHCILLFGLCTLSSPAFAQEDESVRTSALDSVTVRSFRYKSPVRAGAEGVTVWDMSEMSLLPQLLGQADPMHYAQMLPGIQTNNEYRSGINMEGCESQHNFVSIEGVPIYNASHLLGFFSTFNASHFPAMAVSRGVVSAASPNRLGGQMEMRHDTVMPRTVGGILSPGLISSQGTVRLPVGPRTAVTASLRVSYINLLYGRWLRSDDLQVKYTFYDANVSVLHRLNDRHTLLFDSYYGGDGGGFSETNFSADLRVKWGNRMGAAHWLYGRGDWRSKTTAYVSQYRNRLGVDLEGMSFRLPSGITDIGLKNSTEWKGLHAGFDVVRHDIRPQSLEHEGDFNMTDGYTPPMRSCEASLWANYEYPLARNMKLSGGIRGSLFACEGKVYGAADPSLRWLYNNYVMHFSVTYALRHQYLFQTGFSDSGLPTEFWMSAGRDFRPQYAHEVSVSGGSYLFNRRFRCSADLFYRRLYHQLAYKGSILDYANTAYDISRSLMHGRGENYGFTLMLNKCSGSLTGWIGYTYTHARRSFDETGRRKAYPASHERPHELNVVAVYAIGRHWNLGGTFVYASGTPFTAAQSILLLNGNLILKYGEYNACRLHPYLRLDLSANYKWKGRRRSEQGINFSLYNATARDNELFYYLRVGKGAFRYRPVVFKLHLLPSVSYYCKF